MLIHMRAVTVHEIPAQVTAAEERDFLRNLQPFVETERPRLVLDCSRITRMDKTTAHLLLSCLEEAMKRNGDVKLASLSAEAKTSLHLAGLKRLFEIYPTTTDAVRSYQERLIEPPAAVTEGLPAGAENAA